MNKQEFFDKTARHLLTQNKASIVRDDIAACLYRQVDEKGKILMCAIGVHITNEEYKSSMEDKDIRQLYRDYPYLSLFNDINDEDIEFMNRLQTIHDEYPVFHWKNELRLFALDYELSDNVLNEFK